ncbi:MAG TPA: SAM-dependent methyltransferase [Planctomycetota bacterium]|nr:SAM-dependent methyltransferase [Planctomycetota bacterium]
MTAEMVALVRAREQARPPARRVIDDPYAGRFLELGRSRLVAAGGVNGPVAVVSDLAFKTPLVGFASLVLGRHRVMDDLLLEETAAGATQCVILGAGYDARAHRFAPPRGPARFFEVDHPTLSSLKRDLVARALGAVPPHVTFCAVDFMRERLDERLLAEGFDRAARTVFIWEGVTYYLTAEAVRGTLATVRALAAPGSTIIFDAWASAPGVTGSVATVARRVAGLFARAASEPFLFAFDGIDAAPALLRELGYDVLFTYGSERIGAILRDRGRNLLHVPPYLIVAAGRIPLSADTLRPS